MGSFQDLLWIRGIYSQHFLELCQWPRAGYKCVWEQLWHHRPYPWCELSHHIGRHWWWSKKWSYLHLPFNNAQWWDHSACCLTHAWRAGLISLRKGFRFGCWCICCTYLRMWYFVIAIGGKVVVSHFTQAPPQFHFMWLRSRLLFNWEICPSTVT